MPENALTGGNITIRIQEPSDNGVVIAGIQPIEAGFGVVEITAVSEGIEVRKVVRVRAKRIRYPLIFYIFCCESCKKIYKSFLQLFYFSSLKQ